MSSTVRHRANKRNRLTHLVGCFDDYFLSSPRIISSLEEKEFQRDTSEKSWPNQWIGQGQLRRKRHVSLKGPKQKEIVQRWSGTLEVC